MRHVAVIGGGIAGLVAAHALRGRARVTLFESGPRLGGHVHAVDVGGGVAVETGFLAYHRSHYPQLMRLFAELGVAGAPTGVGLSMWDEAADWVYDDKAWFGLFGDRLPARGRQDLADLVGRLQRHARDPAGRGLPNVRLDDFLAEVGYDPAIARYVLWPSIAALWGFQPAQVMAMAAPVVADSLNRFFITAHHEPFERVVPSTRVWVERLVAQLDAAIVLNAPVAAVHPGARVDGRAFDAAIVATHADQALGLLAAPTAAQTRLLGAFPYHASVSILHQDPSILPADRACWREYNYRARTAPDGAVAATVTWDMAKIQGLTTPEPWFVTVCPPGTDPGLDPARVHARLPYAHPASPPSAVTARAGLAEVHGDGLFFCGSYFGATGSNECAVASALAAVEQAMGLV